jgi:TIR domain
VGSGTRNRRAQHADLYRRPAARPIHQRAHCYSRGARRPRTIPTGCKIFVSYRRDDDPNGAARIRDALTAEFSRSSVFMDVDDLLAGLRFDQELAKALAACDVFLAIIGPRWMDLLNRSAET